MAVERVKPVDRQLLRAVKKLRQLQTQPLTAEEEAQEGQELLTPALSKWMRRMVRAVQPDGAPAPADVTPAGRRRRLLPLHRQTPLREARRQRLLKKKDPVSYTRSLYARGTKGCTLQTHPSQKEDPIFDGSTSFEIRNHPRIVGKSTCSIEKNGTTSYDSPDKSMDGQSVA